MNFLLESLMSPEVESWVKDKGLFDYIKKRVTASKQWCDYLSDWQQEKMSFETWQKVYGQRLQTLQQAIVQIFTDGDGSESTWVDVPFG
jgi:hypothetical protein